MRSCQRARCHLTLRLRVDTAAWRAHLDHVASSYATLVPVVKGNGYGLGRSVLARVADDLLANRPGSRNHHDNGDDPPTIAVGSVFELGGLPARMRPLVLTPPVTSSIAGRDEETRGIRDRLRAAPSRPARSHTRPGPIMTVASEAHVAALDGWRGDVLVKLASSMRRFGVASRELDDFERVVRAAGLTVIGHSIHLPITGDDDDLVAEVDRWVELLDSRSSSRPRRDGTPPALWVSHLRPDAYAALCTRWPHWRFPMRVGTDLWHGDKAALHLSTDVLDVHPVAGGSVAGYRATRVIADGTLVVVGAGTAHGVALLDDGRSPFHFQRRRVALLERPHMHTSMLFVPTGDPCPAVGDAVDVQRPLISVTVDEVIWA
jgi:hypothetical protein